MSLKLNNEIATVLNEIIWIKSFDENNDSEVTINENIAYFYQLGEKLNWREVYREDSYRRIAIPGYPFQRQQYWLNFNLPLPNEDIVQSKQQLNIEWINQIAASDDTQEVLIKYCKFLLSKTLKLSEQTIDISENLLYYGLDSLTALEIRQQIQVDLAIEISIVELLGGNVQHVTEKLLELYQNSDQKQMSGETFEWIDLNSLKDDGLPIEEIQI